MIYRAIGLMSGSSLDGLDIAYVHFHEKAGSWLFDVEHADCHPYPEEWIKKLQSATHLNALDYQLLHTEYGHYLGDQVNLFINKYQLHYQVQLIASHGHTIFHLPAQKMTAQIGNGAAIAARTGIPVVSDLRSLDVALGGQGAPIVPIGDKMLFNEYSYCLNIGGIANISFHAADTCISFDICPANRVLNLLAEKVSRPYDDHGQMASGGKVNEALLNMLNSLSFYNESFPKSLSNAFGNDLIFPLIMKEEPNVENALRTYSEHIAIQIKKAIDLIKEKHKPTEALPNKMLITGGGAYNDFLIQRIKHYTMSSNLELWIPDDKTVQYKEALVMALFGVLRWRQENNVKASVTGAARDSIGGALWMGQEG